MINKLINKFKRFFSNLYTKIEDSEYMPKSIKDTNDFSIITVEKLSDVNKLSSLVKNNSNEFYWTDLAYKKVIQFYNKTYEWCFIEIDSNFHYVNVGIYAYKIKYSIDTCLWKADLDVFKNMLNYIKKK